MYQFLHIETYPLHARYNKSKPEKSVKSFVSVSRELMRHPSAVPHIHAPKPPRILYGYCAYTALKLAQDRVNASKDALGRKIRKDAKVILSGVISCPSDFKYNSEKNYQRWLSDNVAYLQDKYGGQLISVILHEDESHPHIHFICVPKQSNDFRLHIKTIHEPIRAREETAGGRKLKYEAYKSAFRKLQDEYYYGVASKFGFLRDGARKLRLTRSEYIKRKESAKKFSIINNDLVYKIKQLDDKNGNLELELENIKNKNKYLDTKKVELIALKKELVEIRNITKERESDMLCLFNRRNSKNSEIDFYKNKLKLSRNVLKRLKRKISRLTFLCEQYKDKLHKQSFEMDCLKIKLKDYERKESILLYGSSYKHSDSNMLTPRQEFIKSNNKIKMDKILEKEHEVKLNRRKNSSLDYEP